MPESAAERGAARPGADASGLPRVSVIVPVYNGGDELRCCLQAIRASRGPVAECIVVDDGSRDVRAAELAQRHHARLLRQQRQQGPAAARNAGAAVAAGDILFFADADVVVHEDAIERAARALAHQPGVAAVFGSYDDRPSDPSFLSQYRNLYHHWNHQVGSEEASTFWTGCGAVRRAVFLEVGGFNESFARPSIEDIEFGYRLRASGHRIRLLKDMQGTHLKRWTLGNMLYTDLFLRGVPWVQLLQHHTDAPHDLNVGLAARLATLCTGLLVVALVLLTGFRPAALLPFAAFIVACLAAAAMAQAPVRPFSRVSGLLAPALTFLLTGLAAWVAADIWSVLPLALTAAVVVAQLGFYRMLARLRGLAFALAAVPLQLLFFMGCGLAVPLGLARHLARDGNEA